MNLPLDLRRCRAGFTLVELGVSMLIVSILMIGLFSSVKLVTSASRLIDGPVAATSDAARQIEQMSSDIRLAQTFNQRSPTAIEFTIADRDGDAKSEIVRYQWLDTTTRQLQRILTLSRSPAQPAVTVLAENVNEFALSYWTSTFGIPEPSAELESDEMLLLSHDDDPQTSANRALLIVADGSSLGAQDQVKKTWMEDWGFTVETISASASQSTFSDAIDRNDVIYIAESVLSTTLGTKVTGTTLGIVCEEPYLCDELGMATEVGKETKSTVLDNTVGTHYLTKGWLPGSAIQILSNNQSLRNLPSDTNLLAPGLRVLAQRKGKPALSVLNKQDELVPNPALADQTVGVTAELPNLTSYYLLNDMHVATKFTLSDYADAKSITASMRIESGRKTRFGIYKDRNGEPDQLVAQTDVYQAQSLENGWITSTLDGSPRLEPGDYWLAVSTDVGVQLRYESTGGDSRVSSVDPTDGLMTNWTGTILSIDSSISIYLTYDAVSFAAGRRVMLPWGPNQFDITQLSDNGRLLMQRSLQWAADPSPDDASPSFAVSDVTRTGQYMLPPMPSNAVGWKPTRLFYRMKSQLQDSSAHVRFRLSMAGINRLPSPWLLDQTYPIGTDNWDTDSSQWYEIPLNAISDLRTDRGVCMTIAADTSSPAVEVDFEQTLSQETQSVRVESSNSGGSWSIASPAGNLRFYMYGTYLTEGELQW